jgi:hypothetical protein
MPVSRLWSDILKSLTLYPIELGGHIERFFLNTHQYVLYAPGWAPNEISLLLDHGFCFQDPTAFRPSLSQTLILSPCLIL